jgi:flagellar export protein FliJ
MLSESLQAEDHKRRALEEVVARHEEARRQLERHGPSKALAGTLVNLVQTVDAFETQEKVASEELRDATRQVGAERDRYRQAHRARRTLERLRERRRAGWEIEGMREEQGMMDEVAALQARRSGAGIQ